MIECLYPNQMAKHYTTTTTTTASTGATTATTAATTAAANAAAAAASSNTSSRIAAATSTCHFFWEWAVTVKCLILFSILPLQTFFIVQSLRLTV
jgi:hypothetical protein